MAREFTLTEVAKHNTKDDLYIVIRNKVYDVTSFADDHPYSFHPLYLFFCLRSSFDTIRCCFICQICD